MHILLAGLGTYGLGWFERILKDYPVFSLSIADNNPVNFKKLKNFKGNCYNSVNEALKNEKPDFMINVTPPQMHKDTDFLAFQNHIPVLSEKPISDNFFDSHQIVQKAEEEKVLFMVAENYREIPSVKKARCLIEDGTIGQISQIHIQFLKNFYTDKEYFIRMKEPLLADITIHHLDTLKYLTGSAAKTVYARSYKNRNNLLYRGNTCLNSLIELRNGIKVLYNGSLTSFQDETDWLGNWRIEGDKGGIILTQNQIIISTVKSNEIIKDFKDIPYLDSISEFIKILGTNKDHPLLGRNYLKNQEMAYYMELSSDFNRVEILPEN